jgi:hypothetical protein
VVVVVVVVVLCRGDVVISRALQPTVLHRPAKAPLCSIPETVKRLLLCLWACWLSSQVMGCAEQLACMVSLV